MFCTSCGQVITEGGRFCTGCGTPLAAEQAPQTVMTCRVCGYAIYENDYNCRACGMPLNAEQAPSDSIICRYCSQPMPENSQICTGCGSTLVAGQAPQEVSAPLEASTRSELADILANQTVIDMLRGRFKLVEGKNMFLPGEFINGYWIFTDKTLIFYYHDWDEEGELQWDRRNFAALEKKNIPTGAFYNEFHSIMVEKSIIDNENEIYLYSGGSICAEFNSKPQKQFMALLERFIPGLTILKKGLADYNPSISEMDPRNPFGTRYDPAYPRGYVVASTKGFPKNFNAMDDAINAAKRDGTLPQNWNLAIEGFSVEQPIPGVPVVFDGML